MNKQKKVVQPSIAHMSHDLLRLLRAYSKAKENDIFQTLLSFGSKQQRSFTFICEVHGNAEPTSVRGWLLAWSKVGLVVKTVDGTTVKYSANLDLVYKIEMLIDKVSDLSETLSFLSEDFADILKEKGEIPMSEAVGDVPNQKGRAYYIRKKMKTLSHLFQEQDKVIIFLNHSDTVFAEIETSHKLIFSKQYGTD